MTTPSGSHNVQWVVLGALTFAFSILYFVSDVIELIQGGFSSTQLALTYAAEAVIPFLVLALYSFQRPRIGRIGFVGALAYAYAFIFFTGTVAYALVDHTSDWNALTHRFGAWITIHSAIMVIAGIMFGLATIRAGVLPRWTGATLILGMILMTAGVALPDGAQTAAAGVRDLAFAGMGCSLFVSSGARRRCLPWRGVATA
jgi:hypothetical protein